jgi:hypothetical protein
MVIGQIITSLENQQIRRLSISTGDKVVEYFSQKNIIVKKHEFIKNPIDLRE